MEKSLGYETFSYSSVRTQDPAHLPWHAAGVPLRNTAERAEQLGGRLELGRPESGGTTLMGWVSARKA
ncbi:hypothetical protein OG933_04525 [Streptomyces sp. NBC_00016]|uniref:hypothetical protein n=1 Tax=Streptomyces sp. NBC_00016 TaxID=2975622 RepID=UPI0032479615